MTARDFTPTDEQVDAVARNRVGRDWIFFNEHQRDSMRGNVRRDWASPAFQSIIAAAKAEALREFERRVYNGAPGKYQAFYNEGLSPELLIAAGEYERDEATA